MQITVYVCYDRQVRGIQNLKAFQAGFLPLTKTKQIKNRKPVSKIKTDRILLYLKGSKTNITDVQLGWRTQDMQSSERHKQKTRKKRRRM